LLINVISTLLKQYSLPEQAYKEYINVGVWVPVYIATLQ